MKKTYKLLINLLLVISLLILASCAKEKDADASISVSDEINEEINTNIKDDVNIITDEESQPVNEDATKVKEEIKVPILSDSIMNTLGCRVGCAVTSAEADDEKVWEIVTTHFNAITLGNELKPDCLFNYSNDSCPGTETVTFNGEELLVPKMNFSRANKLLDKVLEWNEANPEREIKVRGHVLVWHSQTPEWFFHEDYKKSNDYADKETMNKRLEWYISKVLNYYTGEDSKYKDLFYGWDVVNEAVSDKGGYRTDAENADEALSQSTHGSNSSWWHVYESNEYIINAFIYANKYAPNDLELYYNDYNECVFNKRATIIELLTELKEKEGEKGVGTRISAMGMQGHYDTSSPDGDLLYATIKAYCKIVGSVQFTEFDIKETTDWTDAEKENEKIKKRYNVLYYYMKSANSDESMNISNITFWGTTDNYSWLQSRSNIGGGNTTGLSQMPLLFDENYEPKPAFFVFAKNGQ